MPRISVVGSSGSGKSTLARRLADRLELDFVELDAFQHLPGWQPRDPAEFGALVDAACPVDGQWVVDGNYSQVTMHGVVWRRADTVVVLDLPRRQVITHLTARSLRRWVTREELWNGNRESLRNLLRWDPERNVIRWSWVHHHRYAARYRAAADDRRWAHLDFVYLTSHAEADAWLARLVAT